MSTILTLPLNGKYFDAIKDGTKLEEYRLVTPFWKRRIKDRWYSNVVLTRGYPKKGDSSKRLTREWRGYVIKEITHPHFGNDPVKVFAIDVSVPA